MSVHPVTRQQMRGFAAVVLALVASSPLAAEGGKRTGGLDATRVMLHLPRRAPSEAVLDTITINGERVTVAVTLYRDFMPSPRRHPRGLHATVSVHPVDDSLLRTPLRADSLWVEKDESVWGAPLHDNDHVPWPRSDYQVDARRGPEWPIGTHVDVTVRLRDRAGRAYLVHRCIGISYTV